MTIGVVMPALEMAPETRKLTLSLPSALLEDLVDAIRKLAELLPF
jgi:hypothetical protein